MKYANNSHEMPKFFFLEKNISKFCLTAEIFYKACLVINRILTNCLSIHLEYLP